MTARAMRSRSGIDGGSLEPGDAAAKHFVLVLNDLMASQDCGSRAVIFRLRLFRYIEDTDDRGIDVDDRVGLRS